MGVSFYVVSDVWMGQAMVIAGNRQDAERHQYLETLAYYGLTEDDDQGDVQPEQFRAWSVDSFPHELSFEEAFDWIGEQADSETDTKMGGSSER